MTHWLQSHGCHMELDLAYRALKACRSDRSARRRDDLDQCPATINTTLRRLALLMELSKLKRRRILLLGDDDLLSVAISATGLSSHVTVIDLDHSLLERVARWTNNKNVRLVHHDLRLGLPERMATGYDVVFTDPPYTQAGQFLFLRVGITAVRNKPASSIFLCSSRLYLKTNEIQRIIALVQQAGFDLVRVEEDFNKYQAPPNVIEDMRQRKPHTASLCFYSSLLQFVPNGDGFKPETLPFLPSEIYQYQ